jgi:hypothetical protein
MADKTSFYKPKLYYHELSADEAGSGIFTFDPYSGDDGVPTYSAAIYARVFLPSDGTQRTITKAYFDATNGNVSVTGTSFAEADKAEVLCIKYV